MEEYILANKTCALATGAGEFVRCTPIEYTYHHGAFWMFSEGGEKFAALEKNKNVCLAIFVNIGLWQTEGNAGDRRGRGLWHRFLMSIMQRQSFGRSRWMR